MSRNKPSYGFDSLAFHVVSDIYKLVSGIKPDEDLTSEEKRRAEAIVDYLKKKYYRQLKMFRALCYVATTIPNKFLPKCLYGKGLKSKLVFMIREGADLYDKSKNNRGKRKTGRWLY